MRALLRREEMEGELDEELRFHIEKEIEQNVARGMSPAEARRVALVDFGGMERVREECRDARGVRLLEDIIQDLRYALRVLTKSPAFTLVSVLSLALGIGVNATVFGFVNAVMLRPLSLPDHAELVRIQDDNLPTYSDYLAFNERAPVFRGLAAYDFDSFQLSTGDLPARANVALVSGNYFDVLGVRPARGRTFSADEGARPGAAAVAVISHGLWQGRFGADPAVVGKTFNLRRVPFTIIGVTPPEFNGVSLGQRHDLWLPFAAEVLLRPEGNRITNPASYQVHVIGRLKPEVSFAQAQAAVEVVAAQQDQVRKAPRFIENPADQPAATTPRVVSWATAVEMGPRDRQQSWLGVAAVLAVVGLVLLAACANVANLLLGRAAVRRREIAIRLALGASRGRIVRQLLTESLVLSLLGAAAGLLLSRWAGDLLLSLLQRNSPADVSAVALDLSLDWRMLLYGMLVAVATGVAFGLVPALQASKSDVVSDLKAETTARSPGRRRFTFRNALVVTQVAISTLLLIPAGLLLRSVRLAETSGYGFNVAERYVADVDLEGLGYDKQRQRLVGEQLLGRVREMPGVRSATMSQIVPLAGGTMVVTLEIEDEAPGQHAADVFTENGASVYALDQPGSLYLNMVDTGYFETMGIPLVAGRDFTERDDTTAPDVIVVNETLARRLAPDGQALGRRLVERDPLTGKPKPVEVVGVARDAKYIWPSERPRYFAYRPVRQIGQGELGTSHLIVHAAGDPATISKVVRATANAVDSDLSVEAVTRLDELIDRHVGETKLVIWASAAVGALALLLAAVSLYGVMAYAVAGRTKEIGIRMALGAGHGRVRRMILTEGLALAAAGTLAGLLISAASMRLMRSLLYGISPIDPLTYAAVAAFLTAVALLASYVPARRATKVDPMVALRSE
ncbi:MAG TPA: ABC transporter permease [Pyrinomonadaceae bacterium]|nr:ABC transporter permease [Pyrinomonadaceae bacterium]